MGVSERWKGHPPLPEDLEERLLEVAGRLRQGGADLVYVFGSVADGDRRAPQDVDVAVWGLEEDLDRIRPDVEDLLATDRFDLVRMEQADPELRYQIVARGRLLYGRDEEVENRVEMGILREYQDLAPFRRKQRELLRRRHGMEEDDDEETP